MSDLADHLAEGTTTVCRAWVVTRKDGAVYGFTDHDMSLEIDGVTCRASSGLSAGALQGSTGLSVDNVEATGALSDAAITEADLRAGRWDDAEVVAYLVNWMDTEAFEVLFRGRLGEIAWGGGAFSADLRGLAEQLNKVRGRVYQARCDAVLGDNRCRKDLSGEIFSLEVTVEAVDENRILTLPALDLYAAKWFERGRVDVLDGKAAGAVAQVKTDRSGATGRRIELWSKLLAPLQPGARIRLTAGCDKRAETCRFKFDNFLNYRGCPHIPGEDWLLAYPTSGAINDGGKR
ncbi:hypothetical protein JANAI62_22820 [Jannaschia pagri]|uniref:Bacteriophage phiJL001 Gp84 C-terminal domain-containing protein n=1 Tax=Jannaschia pagri TaxID=2829797 RepID=A0ABQ4NMP2_9RHOB|nr:MULTISPECIES: DUF2163 domain-containing protein [unclassified Jannaschia]GIT91825.1 hypothetical protein JANAI61_22830 [Jannaschia sp. AI_61]GIT95659.1 hypothetical protein JANAI62_22820 [Jannaschia sp. AI_62]